MQRNARHEAGVRRVSRALDELGIVSRRADRHEADLVLEDGARVVVHCSKPAVRLKRIRYEGVHGDPSHYEYRRRTLHWNLHVHGEPDGRRPDWIICLSATDPDCFLIPGATAIKTLRIELDRKREYHGRYAIYRNAWHLLTSSSQATDSRATAVTAAPGPLREHSDGGPGKHCGVVS